jgi:hypothetical protein
VALRHAADATGRKAQEQEFAADAFATEAFARNPQNLPRDMFPIEVAVPALFDILEAAERRLPTLPPEATHPTAAQRRERVSKLIAGWPTWQTPEDAAFASVGL